MNRVGFAAISLVVVVLAGAATLFSSPSTSAAPANLPTSGTLYGTDAGGGNLYSINPTSGVTALIGPLGIGQVPALAGNATTLYAGTGSTNNRLYSVNPVGPSVSPITPVAGSGLGVAGFGSMDFDSSGVLYATANIVGGIGEGADYLVTVNTTTGMSTVVGSFGTCSGVTIPAPGGPNGTCSIEGMEGIAFDSSGQLWGILNERGHSPMGSGLYKISTVTGSGLATFQMAMTGGPIAGAVSLQFACNGTLYGGSARQTDGGRLGTINTTTGAWSFLTPLQTTIPLTWTGGPQFNSLGGLAAIPSNCPFNVNKVFNPADAGSVTVAVTCTNGGVATATDSSASTADDANFTVTGFTLNSNPMCTATETAVPAGYTINTCAATLSAGSCTITNNETNTTFAVTKAYSPSGPAPNVAITITCTGTGTVVMTPAGTTPHTTVVKHFPVTGTTCSASETTVPAGYTMTSTCTNVPITSGTPASCVITNTLCPSCPTPVPAVGGIVDLPTTGSGSASSTSWLAILVLAVVTMGIVTGGTLAVVRKRS